METTEANQRAGLMRLGRSARCPSCADGPAFGVGARAYEELAARHPDDPERDSWLDDARRLRLRAPVDVPAPKAWAVVTAGLLGFPFYALAALRRMR